MQGCHLYQLSGIFSELVNFAQCTDFIPKLEGSLKIYSFSTFLTYNTSKLMKAKQYTAELGTKSDANHTCTTFLFYFFVAYIFFLFDTNEKICFCFKEFSTLT